MNLVKIFSNLIDNYGATALLGSDGSCSCGEIELFGIKIESSCWRKDGYSHIIITSKEDLNIEKKDLKKIGKLFAKDIEAGYISKVKLVVI